MRTSMGNTGKFFNTNPLHHSYAYDLLHYNSFAQPCRKSATVSLAEVVEKMGRISMSSFQKKLLIALFSTITCTILVAHVLQVPEKCLTTGFFVQELEKSIPSSWLVKVLEKHPNFCKDVGVAKPVDSIVEFPEVVETSYPFGEHEQYRCIRFLSLEKKIPSDLEFKNRSAAKVKGIGAKDRVIVTTSIRNEPTPEINETRGGTEDLPVPECNNEYVSVAGREKLKTTAFQTNLSSVNSIEEALAQIKECAYKTGASKLLEENGGKQLKVFILSVWRSGSSFSGEAISSHPGIYYFYEPLGPLSETQIVLGEFQGNGSAKYPNEMSFLRELSSCNHTGIGRLSKSWINWDSSLKLNNKLRRQGASLKLSNRTSLDFVNGACRAFPVLLFKFVRLRGMSGETLLQNFPGSKIIYLFRDPRSILASRLEEYWCPDRICRNVSALCCSLKLDVAAARYLQRKYPLDVQVVQYEHLAMDPLNNFKKIFENIGVSWHPNIEKYLSLHTKSDNKDSLSTVKNSASRVGKWKQNLKLSVVEEIQEECDSYMNELGYSHVRVPEKIFV